MQRTGLDVVVAALAVLGLWRLSGSSAATSDLSGRLGTDPVLVLAPTLGVVAASLLTLRAISVVANVVQRVTARRPCQRLRTEWTDVSASASTGHIAVVAENHASFGPVILLLGSTTAEEPRADGWSVRMMRGFQPSTFQSRTDRERERVLTEGQALGVAADNPVLSTPVLHKLSLHRIPSGPLGMSVTVPAT